MKGCLLKYNYRNSFKKIYEDVVKTFGYKSEVFSFFTSHLFFEMVSMELAVFILHIDECFCYND